jgi:murein DD-endopeptidase MepM/ murein hydrolase activator NlpD
MSKKDPQYVPIVTIYTYKPQKETDIYGLSARVNIPYDTLASINRVSTPEHFKILKNILIPSIPGVFVPFTPESDLEEIMCSWRPDHKDNSRVLVIIINGKKQKFTFAAGQRFSAIERAFFLNIFFRFPLPRGIVSSGFGTRKDPLSGLPEIHDGIDIAAPIGIEIFSVRDGKITKTGFDRTYGNFVLITHPGDYQSFYGHLKDIFVHEEQSINSGGTIGTVGNSGRSTGPHLHFEIRKKGLPVDPSYLIKQTGLN